LLNNLGLDFIEKGLFTSTNNARTGLVWPDIKEVSRMNKFMSTPCHYFYFSIEVRTTPITAELACEAFEKSRTNVDDGLEHLMIERPVLSITGLMR
jgi:hypothetical protein